jgi:glutamyl endopeptidase
MKKIDFMKYLILFSAYLLLSENVNSQDSIDTIFNTDKSPFKFICSQQIHRIRAAKDGDFLSTGFFIAPNIVLTAAHNLYSTKLTKVSNIILYPGRYKNSCQFDTIKLSGLSLCQKIIKWHPNFRWNHSEVDFGIIVIPDSIIKKTKHWFQTSDFILDSSETLKIGDTIYIAGFPDNGGYHGDLMTYQFQQVKEINENTFKHTFKTEEGNSGSPIWIERNGNAIIVGIHTYLKTATKLSLENSRVLNNWLTSLK